MLYNASLIAFLTAVKQADGSWKAAADSRNSNSASAS